MGTAGEGVFYNNHNNNHVCTMNCMMICSEIFCRFIVDKGWRGAQRRLHGFLCRQQKMHILLGFFRVNRNTILRFIFDSSTKILDVISFPRRELMPRMMEH
jgi:hypothetical protein